MIATLVLFKILNELILGKDRLKENTIWLILPFAKKLKTNIIKIICRIKCKHFSSILELVILFPKMCLDAYFFMDYAKLHQFYAKHKLNIPNNTQTHNITVISKSG